MIGVKELSFSYPGKKILSAISFDVQPGEVVGILGANGAGKTTLFKLLNGRLKNGEGTIEIDGRILSDYSAKELARTVAIVPQNPTTDFQFTVKELITMGRNPYQGLWGKVSDLDRSLIDSVIAETGLTEFADRFVTELSGGERQLVFLARAFVQQPRLLLLDEATSNLDINHTLDIFSLVKKRVKENGLTVAAIIHDINLAALFCDKIVFISDASVMGPDLPEKMITRDNLHKVYGVKPEYITISSSPLSINYSIGSL